MTKFSAKDLHRKDQYATTAKWTTRLPLRPELVGQNELHTVWFRPTDWRPGTGNKEVINLLIPECEQHCMTVDADGEWMAFVNRPVENRDVKSWTRSTCKLAVERGAALAISCNSIEQTALAVRRAERWLPAHYKRVPLERILAGAMTEQDLS